MSDEGIQLTNDDASLAKLQAIQQGYWKDDYLRFFVKSGSNHRLFKKPPEINRGYYIRVKCIENILKNFLKLCDDDSAQIINLGCGFDSLFWRLCDDENVSKKIAKFIDIDFISVTLHKILSIRKTKQLFDKIKNMKYSQTDLISDNYNVLGIDLRKYNELDKKLKNVPNFDFDRPTLFLSECVLVYMENNLSEQLIRFIKEKFSKSLFVVYEMINLNDSFGKTMVENFQNSKFGMLLGLKSCTSLEAQKNRFLNTNWLGTKAWTLTDIYNAIADRKIENIEYLDEKELLTQLLDHYCICIAWNFHLYSQINFT